MMEDPKGHRAFCLATESQLHAIVTGTGSSHEYDNNDGGLHGRAMGLHATMVTASRNENEDNDFMER